MSNTTYALINIPFTPTFLDYPDPENISISVYLMGCPHKCSGCSSPQFSDIEYSKETKLFNVDTLLLEIEIMAHKNKTTKISLMGGDPLYDTNLFFTKELLNKNLNFDICIYTGYNIEYVIKNKVTDFTFIKCGTYDKNNKIKSEKTDEYIQFASNNQKLYDMNYTLLSNNGKYYFK